MAEAGPKNYAKEVDDGKRNVDHESSDQEIDPWCEPCLEETKIKLEADCYCPECNSHLCVSCQEVHKKWPTLQNHRLLRGARMPKFHADKPVKYPSCPSHVGKLTDKYCLTHSKMVCNDCVKRSHLSCETLAIPDVCKIMDSTDVKRFKTIVNNIQENVKDRQATLRKNISDIEIQKKAIIKRAESEKEKLIYKVKDILEETVLNVNETCLNTTSEITEQIEILSDENRQLDEIIDTFDKKTVADIDANTFVQIQNIVTATKQCKQEIEDTIDQLHVTDLAFALNEEIDRFHEETKLGTVKKILIPIDSMDDVPNIAFPQQKEQKPRIAMDISKIRTSLRSVFKIAEEKEICEIYGMAVTTNGILLIADRTTHTAAFLFNRSQSKVRIFSEDNALLTTFDMSEKLLDIALIDDTEAVASTVDKKLHFLDITDPSSVAIRKSVTLTYIASRVTTFSGIVVVASQQTKPASLRMIDGDGQELWCVTELDNVQLFEKPSDIRFTTFNGTNAIVVADSKKRNITFVDASNGAVLNVLDFKDKEPQGLATDDNGNIFFCCKKTGDIMVLSNDLSQCGIFLKGQESLMFPINLLYRNSTSELYVAHRDEIQRFQISLEN